jgi:hypothetical protein
VTTTVIGKPRPALAGGLGTRQGATGHLKVSIEISFWKKIEMTKIFRLLKNFENGNSLVSLDREIERLFGAKSLRTAKLRLNLLEGRARRRCFPFVARYPLCWLLLTLGTPARLRVFPRRAPASRRARPPRARCPQRVRGGCSRRGA